MVDAPVEMDFHYGDEAVLALARVDTSGGIDSKGDFYEAALNAAGIATLQIDMREARGAGAGSEPQQQQCG
jgi:hypothetical protein